MNKLYSDCFYPLDCHRASRRHDCPRGRRFDTGKMENLFSFQMAAGKNVV